MLGFLPLLVVALQQSQGVPHSYLQTVSDDGKQFAYTLDDGTLHVCSLPDGKTWTVIRGTSGYWRAIAFSPDGSMIASVARDGSVRLDRHSEPSPADEIAKSPDWDAVDFVDAGTKLLLTGASTRAQLVNVADGHVVHEWTLASDQSMAYWSSQTARAVSPDGKHIAIGNYLGRVGVYSAATGAVEVGPWQLPRPVSLLAFDKGARRLAIVASDCKVRVAVLDAKLETAEFSHSDQNVFGDLEIDSVSFSPDGKSLLTATSPYWEVRLWDLETGRMRWTYDFGGGNPTALEAHFTPDGTRVLVSRDGLRLDASTGRDLGPITQEQKTVCRISGRIAWYTVGSRIEICDAQDWKLLCTIPLVPQVPAPR